jgi:hypothetical protein
MSLKALTLGIESLLRAGMVIDPSSSEDAQLEPGTGERRCNGPDASGPHPRVSSPGTQLQPA